jgi:hypothetical protein
MEYAEGFDPELHNLGSLLSGYKGNLVEDNKNLIVIRGARNPAKAVRVWLDKRTEWLNYLTVSQRRWQRNARSLQRANHHDSVSTREKYVRVYSDSQPIPDAYKGVYRGVCRVPECPYSATTEYFLCRKHRNASVADKV